MDEHGNHSQQVLTRGIHITSHQSVLSALKAMANRSLSRGKLPTLNDKLLSSAVDKTGTVDYTCEEFDGFSNEREQLLALVEQQEVKELKENGISDKVLQIHGLFPTKKGEGIICLVYENVNGIISILSGNNKVEKAREIRDNLEVDIVAYNNIVV
jgi:hypothetical protein